MLARCRRRVVVVDAGEQRNRQALALHGYLTRDGSAPADLLRLARAELGRYPTTELRTGTATEVSGSKGGFEVRISGGPAVRALDVVLLGVALEQLVGIDPAAVAGGGRVAFTKSAADALAAVDAASDDTDAAFLLEPTPVASIIEVAAAGDVMPQKSTYFHPKAPSGLVINPHEW